MSVRRSFQEALTDLPEVAFPDWALWEKIEQLVLDYTARVSGGVLRVTINGFDRRGRFETDNIGSLRKEIESRGEQLTRISLHSLSQEDDGNHRSISVVHFAGSRARVEISSGDEVLVRGLAARFRDLFDAAAQRFQEEQEQAEREAESLQREQLAIGRSRDAADVTRSRGRGFFGDVLGQVVAGVIVGLILLGVGLWLGLR